MLPLPMELNNVYRARYPRFKQEKEEEKGGGKAKDLSLVIGIQ